MQFSPEVGLSGFQVVSSFDIGQVTCKELSNEIHQLAIVLRPPDLFNEKFLIKMRDCVLEMPESHPVKRWLKSIGTRTKLGYEQQEITTFLAEVLNSQFNLITDVKIKTRIINILTDLPQRTLGETVLKSYLYLVIGNISKSDALLKEVINRPPYQNWQGYAARPSFYERVVHENLPRLLARLAKHPSDRTVYQLFAQYILRFYNDADLIGPISNEPGMELGERLNLKFVEGFAPTLVHHLRLMKMDEAGRVNALRNHKRFPLTEQAYWVWPFFDLTPLASDNMVPELRRIEKVDELWFIYLMEEEKFVDLYFKKGHGTFLPGRRKFLRDRLNDPDKFMLALFKLIEFGDIDQELVSKTVDFLVP